MPISMSKYFTTVSVAANWTVAASNAIPYLGSGLFPAKKKAGLDLSWLRGHRGLPISLAPSAFDAKATFRDRIGFSKIEAEMPFFREGYKIKERDRQELLRARDANDPYAVEILSRVFDDTNDLINGANVVPERMIMQLLFPENGDVKIGIKANGVDYEYNYDGDGSWKTTNYLALSGTGKWSATETADPLADFKKAKDTIRSNTGTELATAVMNTNTFNKLAKTDAVKNRYLTTSGLAMSYLTDKEVSAAISGTTGLNIVVYNKQYKDENGVAHSFVPDDYVCIIPEGNLGNTWYGTTPEEADLMSSGKAEVSIVNTGVAITRVVEAHPVNINLFASEIVLPSYERMDEVYCMKVD